MNLNSTVEFKYRRNIIENYIDALKLNKFSNNYFLTI